MYGWVDPVCVVTLLEGVWFVKTVQYTDEKEVDRAERFIVVKKVTNQKGVVRYKTAPVPRKHLDAKEALDEAIRLSKLEKKSFSVFKEVFTVATPSGS